MTPPGCRNTMMENLMIAYHNPINGLTRPGRNLDRENACNGEYRNLIRILTFTIDILCDDSEPTEKKLRNIRLLILSLSTFKVLAEQHESGQVEIPDQNFVDDLNGTRYCAVSNWELERFSKK
jgi:hypothetical protein